LKVDRFDLRQLPATFYENPYPTYRALRASAPVHLLPDGSYFLSRHADLERIYRDSATFSSDKKIEFRPKFGDSPLYEHHTTSLVFNDPPLHTRVRRKMMGALLPSAIADMEPGLVSLVDRLVEDMAARGEADLIADFASVIPVEIIGNLLGVPLEDRAPLRGWSLAILGALEPALTPEMFEAGNAAVRDFKAYLQDLARHRRAHPRDESRDVLTRLLRKDADGTELGEDELLQNCIFILNAGHETTTNLIGNALQLLIEWPAERCALMADPALIATAVEEFLRFESSNQLGNRRTTIDTEVGGIRLPAGTLLNLCIGAANRDPDVFEEPESLNLARAPNRHLAFASGPHLCAGQNLARLEARVAIARFLERFPNYRPTGTPVRAKRARFRGFRALPVLLK
jgi:cytochrome P450